MLGNHADSQDKRRSCPYCRMEISVFATKCFHCGERVEPPRTDQRHFSTEDLGGLRGTNYAPSESVMAALETFRAELTGERDEGAAQGSSSKASSGGDSSSGGDISESGLPVLDERSKELASIHEESRPTGAFAAPYGLPKPSPGRRLANALAVLIVLAVLGVGAFGLYSMMQGQNVPPEPVIEESERPPNRAPALLEEGRLLDAVSAARDAVILADTSENKAIQQQAREALYNQVQQHITAAPWKAEDLDQAVELATQAAIIDPSDFFANLEGEVKKEEYTYRMMLVRPEPDGARGKARFRFHALSEAAIEAGDDSVTVEVGEEFAGRFRLVRVGRSEAEVEDLLRGRRIIYYLSGSFAPAG